MLGSSQESRYPKKTFKEVVLVHHLNLGITRKFSRKLYWFITNIQKSQEKMKVSSSSLQAFGNPEKKMKVNVFDGSPLAFENPKKTMKVNVFDGSPLVFENPNKEMGGSSTCSSPSFLCHIHHNNPNIINVIQVLK